MFQRRFLIVLIFLLFSSSFIAAFFDFNLPTYDPDIHPALTKLQKKYTLKEQDQILIVSPARQELYIIQNFKIKKTYLISTSKLGLGNNQDSYQTPYGTHYIKDKIGDKAPLGTVFKARIFTSQIASINQNQDADFVTTRILHLSGLEPGLNQGGNVDSYTRNIYIHGTPAEAWIGYPSSKGCIRMKNTDVIELFDLVESGTLVEILNKT